MATFIGAIKGNPYDRISEKDFVNNKKFFIGKVIVKLQKKTKPNYYIVTYYDKEDMKLIGFYGSPNIEDVIYELRTIKL